MPLVFPVGTTTTSFHRDLRPGNGQNHTIVRFEFPTEADRDAFTNEVQGVTGTPDTIDIGSVCRITGSDLLFVLESTGPTVWQPIGRVMADAVTYDNAASGLTATDVQAAIDEVEGRLGTVEGSVGAIDSDDVTNNSTVAGAAVSDALETNAAAAAAAQATADGKADETRNLTAGAGLTGGGDLASDRTFDVVANVDGSIVVNANDIQVGVISDGQHGNRGGGTLHAEATTSVAGFLSAADKTKLDSVLAGAEPNPTTLAELNADITDATLDDVSGARTPTAHASTHESGGADPITGVNLEVTQAATNYTPASNTLGGHLSGLDTALATAGSGDVAGPASSTDNAVTRFDGTTGKLIQNSAVTIDDSGNIATAGTVDGRDVSVDGTKLDTIETGAEVNPSTLAELNADITDATLDDVTGTRDPNTHAASHHIGGTDELSALLLRSNYDPAGGYSAPSSGSIGDHLEGIDSALLTNASAIAGLPADAAPPEITDSTNVLGASTQLAREDHTHAHGDRGGGSLHSLAVAGTPGTAGFLSGADQLKLDSVETGATADQTAAEVPFTPSGDISASNTQAAIVEVRDDTDTKLTAKADAARLLTAGVSLTGGGDLTADLTFDLGIEAFEVSESVGGQILTGTFAALQFDTVVVNNGPYTFVDPNLTVTADGVYKVSFAISVDKAAGGARQTSLAALFVNGTVVNRSIAYGYHRSIASGEDTLSNGAILTLTAADVITVQALEVVPAGQLVTLGGNSGKLACERVG